MTEQQKPKKKLILLEPAVDKSAKMREKLEEMYLVTETASVPSAIEVMETDGAPAAVLIDIHDMEEHAEHFFRFVSEQARYQGVAVLLLSDAEPDEMEQRFLHSGSAADCVGIDTPKVLLQKRIENAILLKDSLTYYGIERMLKALPSNIYLKDSEGRYIFATHYWHHLDHNNDPNWTIRGKKDSEIRKDRENALEAEKKDLELLSTGKGTSYQIEINTDGVQEFFEVIKEPVFHEDGTPMGIVGLINNVTEIEKMRRKFQSQAERDTLTGVSSRVRFEDVVPRLVQAEENYPISLISADCDGLKYINDHFGHKVGDDYLRMTVLLFRMVLPENGFVFRMGGDEFLIVLPNTPLQVAEGYVKLMHEKESLYQIRDCTLSVSAGVAVMLSKEETLADCMALSDSRMYSEKRTKKHARQ